MRKMAEQIPEVVVLRLPLYLRALSIMEQGEREVISSRELGARLRITPTQIRKDLSYFGKFGRQGKGYNVKQLVGELRQILGLDQEWLMALIGVGHLGEAILSYEGFAPQGFKIVAAFDTDERQIGKKIGDLVVQDIAEMKSTVVERGIEIGVVSVPPPQAQIVIDALAGCGLKAILNYAPIASRAPEDVQVRNIDPVVTLQTMTYYLKSSQAKEAPPQAFFSSAQQPGA